MFELTSASTEYVENDNYEIQSVFRGNLIGFDKKKKKYFPILIESCSGFCNKEVEFLDATKIKITYEDDTTSELDLSKIIFK